MGQTTGEIAKRVLDAWHAGETVKCFLLRGNTTDWQTAATLRGMSTMDEINDDEADGEANYDRVTVSFQAATVNEQEDDRGELDIDDVVFSELGDENSDPIDGVGFMKEHDEADDSQNPIVGAIDVTGEATEDRTPNGNDFIVESGDSGLMHMIVAAAS